MKQYKIFKHPSGINEAVKQGWCWPAFFFSFIWAIVKKMWGLGVGVLIGALIFGFIVGIAGGGEGDETLINIVSIIVNIVFGVNGNVWREKNLLSRGFEQMGTVVAANPECAIALYLKGANTPH